MTRRLKDVKTVGKLKVIDNAYFKELHVFETERFFKDKKLRLLHVMETNPLRISATIEEDHTAYSDFKDGGKPDNLKKIITITLNGRAGVEAGAVMQSGDAYVTFDYVTAKVYIFRESEMRIATDGIVLTSTKQHNLNELYTTEQE